MSRYRGNIDIIDIMSIWRYFINRRKIFICHSTIALPTALPIRPTLLNYYYYMIC